MTTSQIVTAVTLVVLALGVPAPAVEAQGPAAVGLIQPAPRTAAHLGGHVAVKRLHVRRVTTAGKGAIIGLVAGAALGVLAVNTGGSESREFGYAIVVGTALWGVAIGALLGHIISDRS